jgi:hypothetical protein
MSPDARFIRCPNQPGGLTPGEAPRTDEAETKPCVDVHPERRILCGWRCGSRLTGLQMRAPFIVCPNRPAASDHVAAAPGIASLVADIARNPRWERLPDAPRKGRSTAK